MQRILCICLVDQIDFNVSKTCLRVAIHEALLQCNSLVIFSLKLFHRWRKGMNYLLQCCYLTQSSRQFSEKSSLQNKK